MKKRILILIFGLLMWKIMEAQSLNPAGGRKQISQEMTFRDKLIDRMVSDFMEQKNIPGLTLTCVQASAVSYTMGYGVSDREKGRSAKAKTIWSIGPLARALNVVAVIQLYERGKLGLQDRLGEYVPNLPLAWKKITVFQLMQQASGIPDYRTAPAYDPQRAYRPEELLSLVGEVPFVFPPGTDVAPSATNFLLLTLVIEKAAQMSYRDFIRKNQIELLGLKQVFFTEDLPFSKGENLTKADATHDRYISGTFDSGPEEIAVGYRGTLGQLSPPTGLYSASFRGFSDIWASAEDLSRWSMALADSTLIKKPENRELIYKPSCLADGKSVPAMAGWGFTKHQGFMDIKGSYAGFSAYLSRFTAPAEQLSILLLANKEGIDFTHLARRIAGVFDKNLGTPVDDDRLYACESIYSVKGTVERIEKELAALHIPVFAKFDHAANAEKVNLNLRPTQVIVFGSPAVGTKVMQENQLLALELPLRVMVWEDAGGRVWMAFPQMRRMAEDYQLENHPVLEKMQLLLENLVSRASRQY